MRCFGSSVKFNSSEYSLAVMRGRWPQLSSVLQILAPKTHMRAVACEVIGDAQQRRLTSVLPPVENVHFAAERAVDDNVVMSTVFPVPLFSGKTCHVVSVDRQIFR